MSVEETAPLEIALRHMLEGNATEEDREVIKLLLRNPKLIDEMEMALYG